MTLLLGLGEGAKDITLPALAAGIGAGVERGLGTASETGASGGNSAVDRVTQPSASDGNTLPATVTLAYSNITPAIPREASPEASQSSDETDDGMWRSYDEQGETVPEQSRARFPTRRLNVAMGRAVTVHDATSVLVTRGLTDCSALAVLSGWNGQYYADRTLMHLIGSSVSSGLRFGATANNLITELRNQINAGAIIIWIAGTNSGSDAGLVLGIGQFNEFHQQPLLDLVMGQDVSVHIGESAGVAIYPNGRFDLRDDTGRGVLCDVQRDCLIGQAANS